MSKGNEIYPAHAAMLLERAARTIRAGDPLTGDERAYVLHILDTLHGACESKDSKRFEKAAGRALRIKPGRAPSELNHGRRDTSGASMAIDSLTICITVENLRRAGTPTPDCFEQAAARLGSGDADRIRKIYYDHWDQKTGTWHATGRPKSSG